MSRRSLTRTSPSTTARTTSRVVALGPALALALAGAVGSPAPGHADPAPAARPAPAVPLSPATAPRGPDPRVPWFDVRRQVVHEGARTTRVIDRYRSTPGRLLPVAGGYLVGVSPLNHGSRLDLLGFDGSRRTVVRTPKIGVDSQLGPAEVTEDGTQVAYQVGYDTDTGYAERVVVARLSDGGEVARLDAGRASVLDVADGEVWLQYATEAGEPTRLARWRWSDDTLTVLPPRLGDVDGVDVEAGYAWRDFRGFRSGRGVKVIPLRPQASGPAWRADGAFVVGFSPGGRRVATYQFFRGEDESDFPPGRVVLRDARTGATIRAFSSPRTSSGVLDAVWETPSKLLVPVLDPSSYGQAVVRLSLGGRVERASVLARGPRFGAPVTLLPPRD